MARLPRARGSGSALSRVFGAGAAAGARFTASSPQALAMLVGDVGGRIRRWDAREKGDAFPHEVLARETLRREQRQRDVEQEREGRGGCGAGGRPVRGSEGLWSFGGRIRARGGGRALSHALKKANPSLLPRGRKEILRQEREGSAFALRTRTQAKLVPSRFACSFPSLAFFLIPRRSSVPRGSSCFPPSHNVRHVPIVWGARGQSPLLPPKYLA